jgi:hypothetical protein
MSVTPDSQNPVTVGEHNGVVICPAGVTARDPPARHVVFGAACGTCPLHHIQVLAGGPSA